MTVFIFQVDRKFKDAGELTDELIRLGAIPKCREPEEIAEPSWRETTNFIHKRIAGSYHNFKKVAGKKIETTREPEEKGQPHVHEYFSEGMLILKEDASELSEVINKAEDLLPEIPQMSFGNGITVIEVTSNVYIAYAVFDPTRKSVAQGVIERIRL